MGLEGGGTPSRGEFTLWFPSRDVDGKFHGGPGGQRGCGAKKGEAC